MSEVLGSYQYGTAVELTTDVKHLASCTFHAKPQSISNDTRESEKQKFAIQDAPNLRTQEILIIKDMLYVLVGLEGNYVRYSKKFDPMFDAVVGPNYNLTKHLDPSFADIVRRMVRISKAYYGLTSFCELYDDEEHGKIVQAFCYEIRQVLKEYLSIVNSIENRFQADPSYSLRLIEQDLNQHALVKLNHCYELVIFIDHENKERAKQLDDHFSNMIKDIKNDLQQTGSIDLHADSTFSRIVKGGLLLKALEQKLDTVKGDPFAARFMSDLFDNVSKDYLTMLNDWITKGEFVDLHDEFAIKLNNSTNRSVFTESYWDSKFSLRKEGLVSALSDRNTQYKILMTGKYLNIVNECGVSVKDIPFDSIMITSLNNSDFYLQIDKAYRRANQLICGLFFEGFDFHCVLFSLKRFYLLSDASRFDRFLKLGMNELKKTSDLVSDTTLDRFFESAYNDDDSVLDHSQSQANNMIFNLLKLNVEHNTVYNYLLEILNVQPIDAEQALSSSNVSFLKALLNKTLESEQDDRQFSLTNSKTDNYTIFKLNFDISLPFPLNLIINRTFITQFKLVHRHIMVMKFVDKHLENSWREISFQKFWKYSYGDSRVNKWMIRSRVLHNKMKCFMSHLQFYILFDVVEASWLQFESFLTQQSDDCEFESVYISLQTFINAVFTNSFLTSQELIDSVNKLFTIVILYSNFLSSLRKTLVLLDEELFREYESKINDKAFDALKNSERIDKLNKVLQNYDENFTQVLKQFSGYLKYHGETDCFALLALNEKLELSGLI